MKLQQLKQHDIELGKPLPWSVYDRQNNLLLRRGSIIETATQLEALLSRGLYREPAWHSSFAETGSVDVMQSKKPQEKNEEKLNEQGIDFDAINIRSGEILQVQIIGETPEQDDTRYYIKLIGYLKNQTLLVTTPMESGQILLMRPGQGFVIRLFAGRNVYAFSAEILRVCNGPFPYLHLSYPKEVRTVVLRSALRSKTQLNVAIENRDKPDSKTASGMGAIVDISTTGALIEAKEALGNIGNKLTISFKLTFNGYESELALAATIRSIRDIKAAAKSNSALKSFGVEFDPLDQVQTLLVENHVYRKIVEGF